MRLTPPELLEGSAKQLKQFLPELTQTPEYIRSEIFSIYSMLKYLSLELQRNSEFERQKIDAFNHFCNSIRECFSNKNKFINNWKECGISNEEEKIFCLINVIDDSECPKDLVEKITKEMVAYFDACNKAEMNMFR